MIKREEILRPDSCLNKARESEMLFVLLGRNEAAPIAIQAWIEARIRLGKNAPDDPQIQDARRCAEKMLKDQDQ